MILTWNLDQWLNLRRQTRRCQNKIEDDIVSANHDAIVIFRSYGLFGAIWNPVFGHMACKPYINLLSYKNWKKNEQISQLSYYRFE